ncbi:MAG TPA: putative S-layer protein [Candidatus Nanoarchaeia archaeon]|nr:putative S-layer protein [Candidatus Nanoarchaeia archaeon]
MSLKSLSLFAFSIFALVLVMGMASATTTLTVTSGATQSIGQGSQGTVVFTLTSDTTPLTAVNYATPITFTLTSNPATNFTVTPSVTPATQTTTVNIPTPSQTLTFAVPSSQVTGTYTGSYTPDVTGDADPLAQTLTVTVTAPAEIMACNAIGNPGQLRIKSIDFANNGMQYNTFGEDDEWFPFEEIEVDMEVENEGDDDIDDISVEWGIWDTEQNQWVIDLDEEDEINLKDGDEETLTITFNIDDDMDVDLDELGDGDHYRFYVVATGTVDNSTSPETCASDFETASIVIESDFVILDNFNVPETVQCGETVTITADAWNIGDNDQDEVSVFVTNNELGVREDIAVGDIDAFDRQQVSLTFSVPSDAEEKTHRLSFEVFDEDNDLYENDFDDDPAEFSVPLQVSGGCGAAAGEGEVSVVANIVSGGREGQELVVRATVTNTGDSQQTYSLNAAGFEDWASSFSLDTNSLTLGAGESGNVLVTLDVNDGAAGSRTFFLELVSEGQLARQPVTVSISGRGAGITGLITEGNWYLWGIGLLNIILVVVIIVVAVRIARK